LCVNRTVGRHFKPTRADGKRPAPPETRTGEPTESSSSRTHSLLSFNTRWFREPVSFKPRRVRIVIVSQSRMMLRSYKARASTPSETTLPDSTTAFIVTKPAPEKTSDSGIMHAHPSFIILV